MSKTGNSRSDLRKPAPPVVVGPPEHRRWARYVVKLCECGSVPAIKIHDGDYNGWCVMRFRHTPITHNHGVTHHVCRVMWFMRVAL